MKKNIIALAVAAAFAAPVAMADAPTVYGQFNLNVNSQTDGGNGVDDTASRIGIKGSEDLGNGMKVVYKAEFSLDVERSGGLGDRNQYLGLAGGFGTVLLGQHDSPLKVVQPTDTFNDGAADNSRLGLGVTGNTGEIRAQNVLAYVSPSFGGVTLVAAGTSPTSINLEDNADFIAADVSGDDATFRAGDDRSIMAGTHLAAMYGSTKKGLFLSAGMDAFDTEGYLGVDGGDTYTQTSFSAQYVTGGLLVNGTMRTFDDGNSADARSEGTATIMNIAYKMGKVTLKAKYMSADYAADLDTATQTAIGLAYAMGKKTTGYVYTTSTDDNSVTNQIGADETRTYVGMVHKF